MKMNKQLYAVLLLLFIFGTWVFAKEKDAVKPPSKHEVVLVFAYKVTPSPNTEFFAAYDHDNKKKEDQTDRIAITALNRRQNLIGLCEDDAQKIRFAMVKLPFAYGQRFLQLNELRYHFANIEAIRVTLPIYARLEVPEDVRYVYLGDFNCKCRLPFYDIIDIEKKDNFEEAAEAVKTLYGEDAELVRLPLQPLKE